MELERIPNSKFLITTLFPLPPSNPVDTVGAIWLRVCADTLSNALAEWMGLP